MQKLKVSLLLSIFSSLVVLALAITGSFSGVAQDSSQGEGTPLATEDPIIPIMRATAIAEFDAMSNSMTIANFNIAYLLLEGAVAPDRFTAPQSVREIFGADLFYSWEAFAEANLVSPYHVVFIHNSIFEQVDLTWTNWAYRNQIMLVGFSMPFDRIIALTGDQCITEINKGIWDDVEETITFYTYSIQLEDERYRAQIDERKLIYCDEQFDLNDTSAGLSKGSSLCGITRIEDLTSLVSRIITTRMNQQLTAHPIRVHPRLLPLVPASLNPISTPTP